MAHAAFARNLFTLCLVTALAFAAGCSDTPPPAKVAGRTEQKTTPPKQASVAPPAATKVELKAVKSSGLEAAIKEQKGKIVVVDFWATWCVPCKREFPHLVEIFHDHAKDGVACISVSVDSVDDKAAALKFLEEKQATFPNFLLDEDQDSWQKNWKIKSVPVVYVFDRQGQRVKKFDEDDPENQFTYADVTKLVNDLLSEKQ